MSNKGGLTINDLAGEQKSRRIFGNLPRACKAFLAVAVLETIAIIIAEVVGMIVYGNFNY
jgi:hypothetical protein